MRGGPEERTNFGFNALNIALDHQIRLLYELFRALLKALLPKGCRSAGETRRLKTQEA